MEINYPSWVTDNTLSLFDHDKTDSQTGVAIAVGVGTSCSVSGNASFDGTDGVQAFRKRFD